MTAAKDKAGKFSIHSKTRLHARNSMVSRPEFNQEKVFDEKILPNGEKMRILNSEVFNNALKAASAKRKSFLLKKKAKVQRSSGSYRLSIDKNKFF